MPVYLRSSPLRADANNEAMPGQDLLKELVQALIVREKTSPPLHESLAAIFNNLLLEKIGEEKLKAKLDKYPHPGFSLEAGSHTSTRLL